MEPPWAKYPDMERQSVGWRMGDGEDYYNTVYRMFSALPPAAREDYEQRHPEPPGWSGWYDMVKANPWT
jgi:hypothetical protein